MAPPITKFTEKQWPVIRLCVGRTTSQNGDNSKSQWEAYEWENKYK
jgi:hypothetical protein